MVSKISSFLRTFPSLFCYTAALNSHIRSKETLLLTERVKRSSFLSVLNIESVRSICKRKKAGEALRYITPTIRMGYVRKSILLLHILLIKENRSEVTGILNKIDTVMDCCRVRKNTIDFAWIVDECVQFNAVKKVEKDMKNDLKRLRKK